MKETNYDPKRLRRAALVSAVIFAVMLIFSVLQWGFASQWGNIKITRVTYVGEGGSEQSGLMFVPNGVSAENPAPAVINFHGRNNSSYNMINWAIEEARRGYIVLNPDLAGTLETSLDGNNSTANLAVSPVEYLESMDMVSEISVTGHSMANLTLQEIEKREADFKPKLKTIVGAGGVFMYANTNSGFSRTTNHLIVEGAADLYEYFVIGGLENAEAYVAEKTGIGDGMEKEVIYGNFEENNAFEYVEIPGMSHQGLLYDSATISSILEFLGQSSPAPSPLETGNMVFPYYLICSAIAFISFLFFIPSITYTITSLPGVYELVNVPYVPSKGKSGKKWAWHLITDLAIPLALFVPVTMWAKNFPTDFFCSLWVNQIFLWLVACSLIGIVLLVIRLCKKHKMEKITPADFGFGTANEKIFCWKRIGGAIGITAAVVMICYTWLGIVTSMSGLNYQFFSMPGQLVRMAPERVNHIFRYMLMMIPVYFMIGVNVATSRRLKDTGNEVKDTVKAVLVNILLSAGVLTALVVIQFVGIRILGDGSSPFPQTYWDSISFGWTFPFMMGTAAGTNAFMYRKTGNVWVGMIVTWTIVIAMTILQCCLVPSANIK